MEILVFSKIANFAQNFLDMAKTKKAAPKKATAKKAVKSVAKSSKKVVKPATKKIVKPVAKKKVVVKPIAKKAVKQVAKKKVVAKPVAKKKVAAKVVAKKAVKVVVKKAAKKAVKPIAKKVVKKPVLKKAVVKKVAAKPVSKAVKPVAKKAVKAVAKPVVKKVAKPVAKPAVEVKKATSKVAVPVGVKAQPKVKAKKVLHEALPAKALITIQKPVVEKEKPVLISQQLRYSDEELREFKGIIDKKMEAARDELNYLKESLENHTDAQEGNKAWNMEEGSDTTEMEYLMNQISRQNKFIRDLELALVRIENKTYGVCRATGKLIDKNRLRIVPHATLSIEAKNNRKGDDIAPANTSSAHMGSEGEGFGTED